MDVVLVFLPVNIVYQATGFLLGFYKEELSSKAVYVLGSEDSVDKTRLPSCSFIGCCSNNKLKPKTSRKYNIQNVWIQVSCVDGKINLVKCSIKKKSYNLGDCLVILYNSESLVQSELLLHPKNLFDIDHFQYLAQNVLSCYPKKTRHIFKFLKPFVDFILFIFTLVSNLLSKCSCVLRISALASHLTNYTNSIIWASQCYKDDKTIGLKVGNFIASVFLDLLGGVLMYYFISGWKTPDEIFVSLASLTEYVIDCISHLVKWLMGSPAGLKLNEPLNSLLGSLVFYYLDIWRNFLYLARPVLEVFFYILMKLGFLGLTIQVAICLDIFALVSFHVYCIYVYAARLYEIQARGVCSLSRLVLGRKRNPEPGKVDSCPYSTEELLIGTISFAVLLFLLPTTLVYYVVFTGIRVGVKSIKGLMIRTIYFLHTLPVYSTFLWIYFPSYVATTIRVTPLARSNSRHCTLIVRLTTSSWLETVKLSLPHSVPPPTPLSIGKTISSIFTGKLI